MPTEPVALALSFKMERDETTGQATTIVEFRCPNCKQLHTQREIYSAIPANFSVVYYRLECGEVNVAMPWADKAAQ